MHQESNKLAAITIWVDESTEIMIDGKLHNMIGYLITNSDAEEFVLMNKLKQARKKEPICWVALHGNEIKVSENKKIELMKRWLKIFQEDVSSYFHVFLYEKNENFISNGKTYEHYFAKQSVFSLAQKMKSSGMPIETMFSGVKTLTVLFDRRRAHSASIFQKNLWHNKITRMNDLEDIYTDEIKGQIKTICGKDSETKDFTIRFSFLSSACFDAMQFVDCFLYMLRQKLENKTNVFTEIFDQFFLAGLNIHTKTLGFEKIYEWGQKFNFFRSRK